MLSAWVNFVIKVNLFVIVTEERFALYENRNYSTISDICIEVRIVWLSGCLYLNNVHWGTMVLKYHLE